MCSHNKKDSHGAKMSFACHQIKGKIVIALVIKSWIQVKMWLQNYEGGLHCDLPLQCSWATSLLCIIMLRASELATQTVWVRLPAYLMSRPVQVQGPAHFSPSLYPSSTLTFSSLQVQTISGDHEVRAMNRKSF